MDINQVKIFVEYITRMNQSGNIGPDGFNILARQAQMDEVNNLIGQIMNYYPNRSMKPGLPIAPISAEVTSVVSDMLRPLRLQTITQNLTNGQVALPSDYLYLSNLETLYTVSQSTATTNDGYQNWVQVDDITEAELAYRMNSHVKYPTVQAPIAVNFNTYFLICPNPTTDTVYPQQVRLTYWKKPADPIWAYTGTGQNMTYDPINSVNFSLGEGAHNRICWKIIKLFAQSTRDNDLLTFATEQLNTGA